VPNIHDRDPHPIFVVLLLGPEEHPFGIQKDFLCARSGYYREYFATRDQAETIEHVVRLPATAPEVFGYVQNFMYTGQVFPNLDHMPSYEVLIGTWKMGHDLRIDGLCDATLEAMSEARRITQHIPATPLLVQVWKDTPEGSSIRRLLLSWAAEYMRSSESRAEFAKSLPQEVLSELVVAMTFLDTSPVVQVNPATAVSNVNAAQPQEQSTLVHHLDDDDVVEQGPAAKRQRKSDVLPHASAPIAKPAPGKKPGPRVSLPSLANKAPIKRRGTHANTKAANFTSAQKLNFCSDLLTRMLSGPGEKESRCNPLFPSLYHYLPHSTYLTCTFPRVLDPIGRSLQGTCRSSTGRGARLL
jgi:hypothetical protein